MKSVCIALGFCFTIASFGGGFAAVVCLAKVAIERGDVVVVNARALLDRKPRR